MLLTFATLNETYTLSSLRAYNNATLLYHPVVTDQHLRGCKQLQRTKPSTAGETRSTTQAQCVALSRRCPFIYSSDIKLTSYHCVYATFGLPVLSCEEGRSQSCEASSPQVVQHYRVMNTYQWSEILTNIIVGFKSREASQTFSNAWEQLGKAPKAFLQHS